MFTVGVLVGLVVGVLASQVGWRWYLANLLLAHRELWGTNIDPTDEGRDTRPAVW